MKLQLLHVTPSDVETWVYYYDNDADGNTYVRYPEHYFFGPSWIMVGEVNTVSDDSSPTFFAKLEAARHEALEVDEVYRDPFPPKGCIVRTGDRAAYFREDGAAFRAHFLDQEIEIIHPECTQAQAFRWLFTGRLD